MDTEGELLHTYFAVFEMQHHIRQRHAVTRAMMRAEEQVQPAGLLVHGNARYRRRPELTVPRRVQSGDLDRAAESERNAERGLLLGENGGIGLIKKSTEVE